MYTSFLRSPILAPNILCTDRPSFPTCVRPFAKTYVTVAGIRILLDIVQSFAQACEWESYQFGGRETEQIVVSEMAEIADCTMHSLPLERPGEVQSDIKR